MFVLKHGPTQRMDDKDGWLITVLIYAGNNTIETAAVAMSIEPVNAERLLTSLVAMQLVTLTDDKFTNAEDVERFLVADSPSYAGAWMLFGKPRVKLFDIRSTAFADSLFIEVARLG